MIGLQDKQPVTHITEYTSRTQKLAHWLSAALHPLLMPTLLYAILFVFSPATFGFPNETVQWQLLFVIFLMTFALPLTGIFILYKTGSISSLAIEDRQERALPFLTTTLFYLMTTYVFTQQLGVYHSLIVILSGITISIILVTIISFFWKISAHSVGISGMMGTVAGLYFQYADPQLFYPILLLIIIAGLLMSARLLLNAHNPAQVFVGALLGFGVGFSVIYWLL